MPRQRDPRRDEAFEIWKASGGEMKLKDIAAKLGVSDTQVRKWKNLDQWERKLKGNVTIEKRNVTNTKDTQINDDKPIEIEIDENNELTEKQRLFCLYYLKYFNATKAYQKAYGCDYFTAKTNGSRLLAKANISRELDRLKAEQINELKLDARDVLQKYIDIAFADITDYVSFGQREEQVIGMYGPVFEGKGENKKPVMQIVNYVELKDSATVDGTIITEVKQGKDGVSIKLADKMKALEKLSLYFDLFPDNFKRKIEEEKLKIAHYKAFGPDEQEEYEDDGFLEALDGKIKEVWDDEEA
ncbi:small subunit terminase [Deep-sea thermophilic phage D6E]|uniref:terminase small subunit n=1 Tax=Deep-sea thermophilic phage D6E TaxID=749413 RepID=UPI0001F390DC|nr:terminase small subunit [Deep-sea thermophilic phage D6E]ADE87487.1 small subunit terminase [Deep-sea thermophilic phage D6E]